MRALFPLTFLALCTVVAFASCKSNDIASSNANTVNIGQACNVDASSASNGCGGGVCLAGFCRQPCSSDSACNGDGAVGGRCLTSHGVSGCALQGEMNCTPGAGCPPEFLCGSDFACHTKCTTSDVCLNGQLCQAGACYPVGSSSGGPDGSMAPQDASESGSGSSSGSSSGASDAAASPDTSFVSTCTGQALTQFGHIATGDSNANYATGVAVRTPAEMLIFSSYFGPDRAAPADAGTPANIAQIDVQHFDLTTAKKTGASGPLQTTDVDGSLAPFTPAAASNIGLYSAAVGLTQTSFAIALVYGVISPSGGAAGLFVSFLDSSLMVQQTTQIAAYGNAVSYAHVRWENGEFVVSWTYFVAGGLGLKVAKFQYDGSNAGSTGTVPTDDPNGLVHTFGGYVGDQGAVAFTSAVFAVAYANAAAYYPMLTLLDPSGAQVVGSPVRLPAYAGAGIFAEDFVTVAATSQGFIALYDGTVVSDAGAGPPSVLATFVSPSGAVGGTYSFPGGPAFEDFGAARGASDGNGAGFVVLNPGGTANFLYFTGDGSTHLNPQTVIQQTTSASQNDLVSIMSLPLPGSANGSFAVGLYSSAEHLTRMAVSGCPPRAADAGP